MCLQSYYHRTRSDAEYGEKERKKPTDIEMYIACPVAWSISDRLIYCRLQHSHMVFHIFSMISKIPQPTRQKVGLHLVEMEKQWKRLIFYFLLPVAAGCNWIRWPYFCAPVPHWFVFQFWNFPSLNVQEGTLTAFNHFWNSNTHTAAPTTRNVANDKKFFLFHLSTLEAKCEIYESCCVGDPCKIYRELDCEIELNYLRR